jgi:prevent-host-death family protein
MPKTKPEKNVLPVAEARERFGDITNQVIYAKERIVLSKHRKAVLAIVPIEDYEYLESLEDQLDLKEAEAALAEHEASKNQTIPLREVLNKTNKSHALSGKINAKSRKASPKAQCPTNKKTTGNNNRKAAPARKKPASRATPQKKANRQ